MRMIAAVCGVGVLSLSSVASDSVAVLDFTKKAYPIRPALHSSGWSPRSYPRVINHDDEMLKPLRHTYARTHDWALVNPGQRVIDYQYLFPLFDKDAKDPSNYYFAATDYLLELSRNLGLKTFYRLGTSIEHTDGVHFNAAVPKDFDKVAEIFAGIIRHYNRGWADGKRWNIEYWEIWNEPDGTTNMWCLPEEEGGKDWNLMRDKFIKMFVTVLKRLKTEFPEVKVGGPALCWMNPGYFRPLLQACKDAGVAPDFISWHYYGADPNGLSDSAAEARKLCDEFGFTKTELIVNEWHYLLSWDLHAKNTPPSIMKRALDGPTGHNHIDSAAFTLSTLIRIQGSKLDMANYYGCSHSGNWGYMDEYHQPNKNWYAHKTFGEIVTGYSDVCASTCAMPTLSAMPVVSSDGKRKAFLLVDYRGTDQVLKVDVKGIPADAHMTTTLLDDTHDNLPVGITRHGDTLTLVKGDKFSAAFFVEFD